MGRLDNSDIMQLATSGKAEELRDILRGKSQSSLYYFTKVILGYKELAPGFHLPLTTHIENSIHLLKRGYLQPRGHFKSTIISKSYPLWRLCGGGNQRRQMEDTRNLRILIVGESDTVGCKNLNDIRHNVESNQLLKWLFPEIIPDFGKVTWKDDALELARSKSYDEPTIKAVGVGAKLTGFHFNIVIYDDVIGEKAAKSEAEMLSAITWFQFAPGLLEDQKVDEELIAGTRWKHGRGDLYGWIMEEMPTGTLESGRPTGFTWFVRSAEVKDTTTGEVTPAFPERFTMEDLGEILQREKAYKYSCQYLNDPTAPEGADFTEDMIGGYKIANSEDGNLDLIIPDDNTSPVRLRDLSRISFYDPSAGGKSADAENAIVGIGESSDNRIFVILTWSLNCGFGAAIEKWHQLNDKFLFFRNFYEAVGAHKAVSELIVQRRHETICRFCEQPHRRLYPVEITPPGGQQRKDERIRAFAGSAFETKRVYLGPRMSALRKQILGFPHIRPIDQFDALAYAIHLSKPGIDSQELEAQAVDEKARLASRGGFIQTEHEYGGYVG